MKLPWKREKRRQQRRLGIEQLEVRQMLAGGSLIPVAGDFDGDGIATTSIYDQSQATFYLRDGAGSGFADAALRLGRRGQASKPLIGDWDGDGNETPGVYDATRGRFYLKNDLDAGAADIVFRFGPKNSQWVPVAGDFDGDGEDEVGLYDQSDRTFHLRFENKNGPDDLTIKFGPKRRESLPVVGDWDGDGTDTVGVYSDRDAKFRLRNARLPSMRDLVFTFGPRHQQGMPLAGDWDGDGKETIGIYLPEVREFFLNDQLKASRQQQVVYVAPMVDPIAEAAAQFGAVAPAAVPPLMQLKADDVTKLLSTAAGLSDSNDAIIAIVDRGGTILGVRAESDVLAAIPDAETLVFAVDGAVAKARTAAFFANGDLMSDQFFDSGVGAPITSRLIRFISQSTITQREAESNPNHCNPATAAYDPLTCGPGSVGPIGLGGHFPPEIAHTPQVDLFDIEHTNRDSIVHPGPNGYRETVVLNPDGTVASVSGDDILLPNRFNIADADVAPTGPPPFDIPTEWGLRAPESYGFQSGIFPEAQARGIATLPGGVPIYRDTDGDGRPDTLVGAIGVFFPGDDGFATHEQNFQPRTPTDAVPLGYVGQTEADRMNAPKALEAEAIAVATALQMSEGGANPIPGLGLPIKVLNNPPRLPLETRLTLVGIELEVIGSHQGGDLQETFNTINNFTPGNSASGADLVVTANVAAPDKFHLPGEPVPIGYLVSPHDSGSDNLTEADVVKIITDGIAEAGNVRAAIRLPRGSRTKMVFAVADRTGEVLGLYRMPDATIFSIDVAVAKARNTAYYADAGAIQDIDRVDEDFPRDGVPDLPPGIAFTNRTFRFLAEARYPSGVDGSAPGPFSILTDPGINPVTAENIGGPAPFTNFVDANASVLGHNTFRPATNFRDPDNIANQNGVVFFPGSTPLYNNQALVGGFGVSGDGVDQDDVVTAFGGVDFLPPSNLRADQAFVRGVRLPFQKFLRNPEG